MKIFKLAQRKQTSLKLSGSLKLKSPPQVDFNFFMGHEKKYMTENTEEIVLAKFRLMLLKR